MLAHARGFGERHVAQLVDADQIKPLPSAQCPAELAHQGRDSFDVQDEFVLAYLRLDMAAA
jgi:hypothetical protein